MQPVSWSIGFLAGMQRVFLDITFDRERERVSPHITPSLWKGWINGTPHDITFVFDVSDFILRVGFVHNIQDKEVLTLQLPQPDPELKDTDGDPCLGFQPISDTWVDGLSIIL